MRIHLPILGGLALSAPLLVFGQAYTITDLGASSDSYRLAHGINSAGYVVGEYEPTNIFFVSAFWYNHSTNTSLGFLPGYVDAYAYGINDHDQIVGWCDTTLSERAFSYSNGVMKDLGTLGGLPMGGYSEAYAINNSAQIVGTATTSDTAINHAVLFGGTTNTDLGALGGPTYNSSAFGINNLGVIVGESEIMGSAYTHAFIYSNNVMTDLQTLPGGAYSHANAINDAGVVVGESDVVIGGNTSIHAFVCTNGPGSMQDLGTLGGAESSASAINSAGQIVGYAVNSNNVSRAFLYLGSQMLDLNDLIPPGSGWTNLEAAVGINAAGQIAGYGQVTNGAYHAFLLTPSAGPPIAVTLSNAAFSGSTFVFSFATQPGHAYEAQFCTPLAASNAWVTFTNVSGNGAAALITDPTPTNKERYYRVVAH